MCQTYGRHSVLYSVPCMFPLFSDDITFLNVLATVKNEIKVVGIAPLKEYKGLNFTLDYV